MTFNLTILIAPLAMGLMAGGWFAVQILAKKMNIKNHIDHTGGCCGACDHKADCELKA